MRIILIILPIIFFSCKTVKEVVKVETRYDSTAIIQNEGLQRALQETIENYEKEREQWENTGVVFVTEDCPDSVKGVAKHDTPTKIIFENGKLKTVEGPVKSVSQSKSQWEKEKSELQSKIDALSMELEKKEVELSKKEKVLVKEVTRKVWPWWIFCLCIIIGWIGRGYWPRVKNFVIKKGL